ncbi:MAG: nickel pincer cofactor biosynthesis protein LarC [Planctomycetota bacterium]
MRIAYLDCASGISGDMTLGALVDAGVDLDQVQDGVDSLAWPDGTPNCRFVAQTVKKKGFRATQVTVEHEPEHAHRRLHHITAMIDGSGLSAEQRDLATAVFNRLGEAEAKAHGTTIEKVHFHEVGAVDSIADIVGSAIGWDLLGVDRIHASAIPTGTGFVEIAHGRCAIPAPATAELLKGVPLADFHPTGELTTPTGAAIVATVVDRFGPLPAMHIDTIGYGAGQKDFDHPNLLRLIVGESTAGAGGGQPTRDTVVLLETNLDDAAGESIGYCVERLWEAGALDVSLAPIQMKKNRPGVLLAVQSAPGEVDRLERLIFRHTTALGIRRQTVQRSVLPRGKTSVSTEWGDVSGVVASLPDGGVRFTPEYEDCRALASGADVTLREVYVAAAAAFDREQ